MPARTNKKDVEAFLARPGKPYDVYFHKVQQVKDTSEFYNQRIATTKEKRSEIEKAAQGSDTWLRNRVGCCTSSNAAAFVGHSPYDNPLKMAQRIIENKPFDNKFMEFGRKYEPVARQLYETRLQTILDRLWAQKPMSRAYIYYRKHKISQKPVVSIISTSGSLVHPLYHHIRGSPDGIVTINGTAVGLIEIKCSMYGVYPLSKAYHHDQIQFMTAIARCIYPQISDCDYLSFDGTHMSVDPLFYQAEYMDHWYWPRCQRFFFELLFPMLMVKPNPSIQKKIDDMVAKRESRKRPATAAPKYDLSAVL
jgi:hypothetical protein